MASSSVASPTIGLVNIDKLINLSLEAKSATRDKLAEIFEGIKKSNIKLSHDEFVEVIRIVMEANRCHRTTTTRFLKFERRVQVNSHMV